MCPCQRGRVVSTPRGQHDNKANVAMCGCHLVRNELVQFWHIRQLRSAPHKGFGLQVEREVGIRRGKSHGECGVRGTRMWRR